MDYESLPTDPEGEQNCQFKRSTFTKWQWEEIWKNIKEKSHTVSFINGYNERLKYENPYLGSGNIDLINTFVEQLTILLK